MSAIQALQQVRLKVAGARFVFDKMGYAVVAGMQSVGSNRLKM